MAGWFDLVHEGSEVTKPFATSVGGGVDISGPGFCGVGHQCEVTHDTVEFDA